MKAFRPRLGRVLREPTLHFLLLAGALFLVSSTLGARRRNLVEIDPAELETRIAEIERVQGVRLDPAERAAVRDAYVDELILVREALAMGLEDDPRIRDFLVQKMLHVLSADVIQPTEAELAAWHAGHAERYTAVERFTVDELIVAGPGPGSGPGSVPGSGPGPGSGPHSDVAALPATLRDGLERGLSPAELVAAAGSGPAPRHNVLPDVTADDLRRLFGEESAAMIVSAERGVWVGPHTTVRGRHWFRVSARTAAELLPLERVRDQVRLDWIAEQEAERLERRVAELRSRYRVVEPEEPGGR